MKRFFATILLMFYALSTLGLSAQMHLCGGTLSSVSVNSSDDTDSCCCGDEDQCSDDAQQSSESNTSDCCTSTEISTKCPDSHQITPPAAMPSTKISVVYSSYIYSELNHFQAISRTSFSDYSHAPPDRGSPKSPLFLRYRILLI